MPHAACFTDRAPSHLTFPNGSPPTYRPTPAAANSRHLPACMATRGSASLRLAQSDQQQQEENLCRLPHTYG